MNSYAGSLLTTLIFILVLSYSVQKFQALVGRTDARVVTNLVKQFYRDTDEMTYNNGLNFAVAFVSFDDDLQDNGSILDASYGQLKFYR